MDSAFPAGFRSRKIEDRRYRHLRFSRFTDYSIISPAKKPIFRRLQNDSALFRSPSGKSMIPPSPSQPESRQFAPQIPHSLASLRWHRYSPGSLGVGPLRPLGLLGLPLCCYADSVPFVLFVVSALATLRWLRCALASRPVCPVRRVRPVRRVFGSRCTGSALP